MLLVPKQEQPSNGLSLRALLAGANLITQRSVDYLHPSSVLYTVGCDGSYATLEAGSVEYRKLIPTERYCNLMARLNGGFARLERLCTAQGFSLEVDDWGDEKQVVLRGPLCRELSGLLCEFEQAFGRE